MDIMTLMDLFADPASLNNLTLSQKLAASLITTLLGMGITFISLGILQVVIGLLARVAAPKTPEETAALPARPVPQADTRKDMLSQQELVAAITVALALQLETAPGNIVIRDIRRTTDHSSSWSRVGLIELMNNNA